MKNILMIGAGAVGQAYGYQLAEAGHQVTYLIKEKYRTSLEQGAYLYQLHKDKSLQRPLHYTNFALTSDWSTLNETQWDQIYLCVSSSALASIPFHQLKQAVTTNTTLVVLQPGPKDMARVTQHIAPDQVVQGTITLISYKVPLNDEVVVQPGTAYWLPPLAPVPFAGAHDRVRDIVITFKQAQIPARVAPSLEKDALYATAAFLTFIAALETADWQFDVLINSRSRRRALTTATKQAIAALHLETDISPPLWHRLINPVTLRMLLTVAPKVTPFDLEAFFRVHFTKVHHQTQEILQTYLAMAEKQHIDAMELAQLV